MPEVKVSFFAKKMTDCPVCSSSFSKEEMMTGRGRLIAGDLDRELRRSYEPNKKYGDMYPLLYPVVVCPSCFYAAFSEDFSSVPETSLEDLDRATDNRIQSVRGILPELDFREPRRLTEGLASYYFAIMCYDYFPKDRSPVIKQGIASLRAAWICNDLHKRLPNENYDYLAKLFYNKARFLYDHAVALEGEGLQSLSNVNHHGPDVDKNYGYNGVLYLAAYLELVHGNESEEEKRIKNMSEAKRTVARIFGHGKTSKEKPGPLLDMAKDLHRTISQALKQDVAEVESE